MRPVIFLVAILYVWQLPAQIPELIVPAGHTQKIMHLEASPSGALLASSSSDETVKVWDAATGRELHTFRPGTVARDLAFSADERYLAIAAFTKVIILQTSDWSEVTRYEGWWTDGVCFHPQRNELYFLTQRHNSTREDPIKVYAAGPTGGTPRFLASVARGEKKLTANLDLSPDGKTLLLTQGEEISHMIPATGGSATPAPYARRFTPDGDLFFIEESGKLANFGVRTQAGTVLWKLETNAHEVANDYLVNNMAFLPGLKQFYWTNREGMLAVGNYGSAGKSQTPTMRELPPNVDRGIAAGGSDRIFLTGKSPVRIYAFEPKGMTMLYTMGEEVLNPRQLAGSEKYHQLTWGSGGLSTIQFRDRQVIPYGGPSGAFTTGRLFYAQEAPLLGAASDPAYAGSFSFQDATRQPEHKRYKSGFTDARTVAPSAQGTRLAVIAKEGYLIMNTEIDKSIGKGVLQEGDAYFHEHAALSPAGDKLFVKVARYTGTGEQTRSHGRLIDLTTKKNIWQIPESIDNPVFSADGKRIYGEIYQYFLVYDATTGRELQRHPIPPGRFPNKVAYNRQREWITYEHDNRAYVFELATNREYQLTVPGENIPFELTTFFNDDFVAAASREGVLRIFDLRTRRYVAALVRYADSDDWALLAPDGRFDASPGAMSKMYYRVGNQRVALEQLFEGFYTPGLAGEIFNRLPPGSLPPPNINGLRPAPEIEIGYQPAGNRGLGVEDDVPAGVNFIRAGTQGAIITLKGSAPSDRITELRLYRNDKLLGDNARGLIVEDDAGTPANERRYRVRLLPGTNAFRAIALNSQRTESKPVYLTVDYDPPAGETPSTIPAPAGSIRTSGPAPVVLHLITVGIDRYANAELNLNYATADAGAIEENLRRRMAGLVGNVRLHTIRDADATQRNILAQLQQVVEQADADDVLVFYFAGHGKVIDEASGEFYLVPHDVTKPFDPTEGLTKRGISATALRTLSAAVSAQRQLFVLDACQSGGALNALRRGAAEEKAIAELARTTGTHWLTATDSEQLAGEFDELGHGAFTYVFLEGLSGKAAGTDAMTTVNELKDYLEKTLPALTERYRGQAQYPSSYGYGRDFEIGN